MCHYNRVIVESSTAATGNLHQLAPIELLRSYKFTFQADKVPLDKHIDNRANTMILRELNSFNQV